jgi:endo-1,4-beta-xylanase
LEPSIAAQPVSTRLMDSARRGNRRFGAAVRVDQLRDNRDFENAVLRECEYLTPEIALRWDTIEPNRGLLSFVEMDEFCAYASAHNKKVRGHTLLWHLSVPGWANEVIEQGDWRPIHEYFASTISRFGASIGQWDVVNEPLDVGERPDGLRESVFLRGFGPDYIVRAFEAARLFAPYGKLVINEFGLEYDIPVERKKRTLFLKLLERLRRARVPLDGVGLQAHLDLGKSPFVPKVLAEFLKTIREMGLYIVVTELDVKEFDYTLPVAARDQRVADIVGRYLDVVLAEPAVKAVHTWGLSDLYSWLSVTPQDYARYPDAWKTGPGPGLNRGLPLDSSQNAKPVYWAIAKAFSDHAIRKEL